MTEGSTAMADLDEQIEHYMRMVLLGTGNLTLAQVDEHAPRLAQAFSGLVKQHTTPPTMPESRLRIRQLIARALNGHHQATGQVVAAGVTCQCREYWTHNEELRGTGPLPWGRDQLDMHRADLVLDALVAERVL